MGNHNSQLETTCLDLLRETIVDLFNEVNLYLSSTQLPARPCDLSRERQRDIQYVERRVGTEGLSFLTVALPKLGKWLDRRLGGWRDPAPVGFKPYLENGVPRFLGSVWNVVMTPAREDDGEALAALSQVIACLRCVLYAFYKLELDPTQEAIDERIRAFVATEEEIAVSSVPRDNVLERARRVCAAVLHGFELPTTMKCDYDCDRTNGGGFSEHRTIQPKHGPGAVATGEKGDEKWTFSHLYRSVHQEWPYFEWMYGIRSGLKAHILLDKVSEYRNLIREDEPTARLVAVPKDSRGPRLISAEPLEVQFLQQAVAKPLVAFIESRSVARGRINFTDQSVNRKLALDSSKSREWATLDLKDASDRVSTQLFQLLWPERLQKKLLALRSTGTLLPSGERLELKKFAPMGSALCFPVESITFYSVCVASMLEAGYGSGAFADCYVYGDDIIIPVNMVGPVIEALENVGLVVNTSKSCFTGYFRESCGMDAIAGKPITPVRIKKLPGFTTRHGTQLVAWLAYSSLYFDRGMTSAGEYCKAQVERVLGEIPYTTAPTAYLSVVCASRANGLNWYRWVWNADLQEPAARLWTMVSKKRPTQLDSWERLTRNLLVANEELDPASVVARSVTQIRRKYNILYLDVEE